MKAWRGFAARPIAFVLLALTLSVVNVTAQEAAAGLTPEQQEQFLKTAKVVRTRGISKGVTGTTRATLSDGVVTHDAQIQTVDISMTEFRSNRGTELNFKDSWRYNVAAYKLNQILQLGKIPVSVERSYNGKAAAFTWWVDDVLMDEGERLKTKVQSPDALLWNQQMWHVRLFDQLIANVDRNLGNLLIDKTWDVWMIDHTRAFRLASNVKTPANLTKIERGAFERLKALDAATLNSAVGDYLTSFEKRSLMQRRDEILALFEKGGASMIYDKTTSQH
jgi:hypothetical protein